jgi:hypothetical protein
MGTQMLDVNVNRLVLVNNFDIVVYTEYSKNEVES